MKKTTNDWLVLAKYDIDTVYSMFREKRYIYVIFCCQQAIEKALKAHIEELGIVTPPYIHSLVSYENLPCPTAVFPSMTIFFGWFQDITFKAVTLLKWFILRNSRESSM